MSEEKDVSMALTSKYHCTMPYDSSLMKLCVIDNPKPDLKAQSYFNPVTASLEFIYRYCALVKSSHYNLSIVITHAISF